MVDERFRRFAFVLDDVVVDSVAVNDTFAAILSSSPRIVEITNTQVMPGWRWLSDRFVAPEEAQDDAR